jgi:Zn-dependent protease
VRRRDDNGVTDLTLQQVVLRLIAYLFIAAVHGFTVAAAAVAMGDQGPRYDGRLRVSPLVHLDILGTAAGVLFSVGWIKPIAVDPFALRLGRIGLPIVVAAGAAATLASAAALRLIRPLLLPLLPDTASATTFALIEVIGDLSAWFALINVLPVPPLTGAHLLGVAAPAYGKNIAKIAPYTGPVLAVVAATGVFTNVLGSAYRILAHSFLD